MALFKQAAHHLAAHHSEPNESEVSHIIGVSSRVAADFL
jgi:hypothetical protein